MLTEPLFDHFLLRRQHHALPFDRPSALTVFSHDIGTFIQHFDNALGFSPLKVIRRESRVMFLHLKVIIANDSNFGYFCRNSNTIKVWRQCRMFQGRSTPIPNRSNNLHGNPSGGR